MPFSDTTALYNQPNYPNSICWSQDGILAVSAGNSITLFHPGNLSGPRAFIAIAGPNDIRSFSAPGHPHSDPNDIGFALSQAKASGLIATYQHVQVDQRATSLAWSPAGVSPMGGCLLAVVTNDNQVRVFGPPSTLDSEWQEEFHLSHELLDYLEQNNWECLPAYNSLRLRGGGGGGGVKRKADNEAGEAFKPGGRPAGRSRKNIAQKAAAHETQLLIHLPEKLKPGHTDPKNSRGRPKISTTPSKRATKGKNQVDYKYVVPSDLSPRDLPSVDSSSLSRSIPVAFARRFLTLRKEIPSDQLPTYDNPSNHLKGVDDELIDRCLAEFSALYGALMTAEGLTPHWFRTECRRILRFSWDRVQNKLRQGFVIDPAQTDNTLGYEYREGGEGEEEAEREQQEGGGEGEGEGEGEGKRAQQRGGYQRRSARQEARELAIEPFQVPEGFTYKELPPLDLGNEALARKSLVQNAVRRFAALRLQCESTPTYGSPNQCLNGIDVWLVDRVTKELLAAYPLVLEELGLMEAETLQAFWHGKLRRYFDKVAGAFTEDILQTLQGEPGIEYASSEKELKLGRRTSSLDAQHLQEQHDATSNSADTDAGSEDTQLLPANQSKKKRKSTNVPKKTQNASTNTPCSAFKPSIKGGIGHKEYHMRSLVSSTTSAAWSPVVSGDNVRFAILAVGTKAGRIWLWKYTLPKEVSLNNGLGSPMEKASSRCSALALFGSVDGCGWVSCMSWCKTTDGALLLLVGCSDGSVTLHATSESAALDILGSSQVERGIMKSSIFDTHPSKLIHAADGVPVVVTCAHTQGTHLYLAAGKSAGQIAVLKCSSSSVLTTSGGGQSTETKATLVKTGNTATVTGVTWLPAPHGVLVAVTRAGDFWCWQVEEDSTVQSRAPPCLLSTLAKERRGLSSREVGIGAFGIAPSPHGMFVAVLRGGLHPASEYMKQLQIHQKLKLGVVQLYAAASDAEAVLKSLGDIYLDVAEQAQQGPTWDIARRLLLSHAKEPSLSSGGVDMKQEENEAEGDLLGLVADILNVLEDPIKRTETAGSEVSSCTETLSERDFRKLQLAVALRHHLAAYLNDANGLERVEMALYQRHISKILQGDASADETTRLLAADWVTLNATHPYLSPHLFKLACVVYHKAGVRDPPSVPPAREECSLFTSQLNASCALSAPGVLGATMAGALGVDGQGFQLPRCPATLRVCQTSDVWYCRVCCRRYMSPPQPLSAEACCPSACLFCGNLIGPPPSSIFLSPPCTNLLP